MSIFPRLNQRTKVILPIRTNLSEYNEIPEHTVISANTEIPSVEDGPTVVARYRNLTVNAGCTLTTSNRCCGLTLVVDGDLTISGSISMTARGAAFTPSGNHLIKSTLLPANDIVYEIDIPATVNEIADFLKKEKSRYHSLDELPAIYRPTFYAKGPNGNIYSPADLGLVPAVGGAGGAARTSGGAGFTGATGTDRGCGGGGGGGEYGSGPSGAGGAGTCYSGGTGGGGSYGGAAISGAPFGGAGGSSSGVYAGGGAGNPGGTGTDVGGTGTGGLLIIVCTGKVTINSGGSVNSKGSSGGYGNKAGGGGSGGGSVNIFYSSFVNSGILSASGGLGGGSGTYRGGAGGDGCVTLDQYNF